MNRIPNRGRWERVESGPDSMWRIDPQRWVVQAGLALYLLPVLLLVLLIGGFAMVVGGVARGLGKVAFRFNGPVSAGSGVVRTKTRMISVPHYLRKREYGLKDRSA